MFKTLKAGMAGVICILALAAGASQAHASGAAIAAVAAAQAGTPYCFAGGTINGPSHGAGGSGCGGGTVGYDCSGLALYAVYQATGIVLPHGHGMESVPGAVRVSRDALQPGDLVFFGGGSIENFVHVGIYEGDGMMWDANDYNQPVQKRTLAWEEHGLPFVGALRFPGGSAPAPSAPTLSAVNLNPQTGHAEVHLLSASSGYRNSEGDWASVLGNGPAGTHFRMGDIDGDRRSDLIGLYPDGGRIDLIAASGSSGYTSIAGAWQSILGTGPAGTQFEVADIDGDRRLDLVAMYPNGGRVDLIVASGSSGYTSIWGAWQTRLGSGPVGTQFGLADIDRDGRPDLVGLYPSNGRIEVHAVSGASGFAASAGDWVSRLGAGAGNAQFSIASFDGDDRPDIIGMYPTGGSIDLHVATGASGFSASGGDWTTGFSAATTTTWWRLI